MKSCLSPRLIALLFLPLAVLGGAAVLRGSASLRALSDVPPPPTGIIDVHCHTAGIGVGDSGCFVSDAMRRSYKLDWYLRSFGVTRKELEQHGDAIVMERISTRLAESRHVGRAVILALDGAVDDSGNLDRGRTEVYVPNEFVAAQVARWPNLLFGASVNPYRHDALGRLRWAHAHGAVLVKWLPSIQHIDPADERLTPFYDALVELGLPLLTHTGTEHAFTDADNRYCDPERLRLPLSRGVTIIAAHAGTTGRFGGEPGFERLARLAREYPNLYVDVSSLTQLNKRTHLRRVIRREEFRGRLLYGSDYPLVGMRFLVSANYYPFRLSWRERRSIARTENPWDRDVALKHALGLPAGAWTAAENVLRLP